MKRVMLAGLLAAVVMYPVSALGADAGGYSYTTLQIPGASSVRAEGINNAGDIVGTYSSGPGVGHGFVYSKGVLTPIDVPGAEPNSTNVQAINDAGAIAGYYMPNPQEFDAFVDTGGIFTTIRAPNNDPSTLATGINNKGQVVGIFGSTSNRPPGNQGFLYSNGTLTVLDYPGGSNTQLLGINDAGQVVGTYNDQAQVPHGFVYSNGTFRTLDLPGGNGTGTDGINNAGQIALYHQNQSYVYANGVFTPIVFPDPQTSFTQVTGISNNGLLVGNYSIGNTPATQPFVASPIPEPAAAAVFAAGFAPALRRRRQK